MKGKNIDRTGETRTMKNGLKATIVNYFGSHNMTVRFENGEVREHVTYTNFSRGNIKAFSLPNPQRNQCRVGEKRVMNDDFEAELIAYRTNKDCDVLLADGSLREHVYYSQFTKGELRVDIAKVRVGETRSMNNGLMATILVYHNCSNIDIQFEDGFVRNGVRYDAFIRGEVSHPIKNTPKKRREPQIQAHRVGETRRMNNGLMATIDTYRSTGDMDVRFEDGCLVKNKSYTSFKKGNIGHPFYKNSACMSMQEFAIHYYLQKLGFVKIEKGAWKEKGFGNYELDFFHNDKKIAIEYDGSIHKNCVEGDIKKNLLCKRMGIPLYRIRHFDCPILSDNNSHDIVLSKEKTIRSVLIDCKAELESILMENNIMFDTQFINFDRDADAILAQYAKQCIHYHANKRIGERHWANSAQEYMTIIAYRRYSDIDVMFDNGEIREHASYAAFCQGAIALPTRHKKSAS